MEKLLCGDCLERMKEIPDKSIDMIFSDLPYGTTHNVWDTKIDLDQMWQEYKRLLKSGGVVLLFSQQPFTTDLINSNRKWFRYEWIWQKTTPVGFLNANRMPLRCHENIVVFYEHLATYNPQKIKREKAARLKHSANCTTNYGKHGAIDHVTEYYYPRDILAFANRDGGDRYHPTKKPTDLLEYMIKTYTHKGDTVLDPTMGSGSTGVACQLTGRNFIGIEKDPGYYAIAQDRIKEIT